MLSETSYLTAIYCYTGAAGIMLLYLAWWLRKHWSAAWVALVVLLGAALLLTPAYPGKEATTMAPALVVAAFQFMTDGPEAARIALKPLAIMSGTAVVLAFLLGLTVFRRASKPAAENSASEADPAEVSQ